MSKMLRVTEDQYADMLKRATDGVTSAAEYAAARAGKAFLAPKRNKYGAQPQVVDGIRFASKKEAYQDGQLLLRQGSGQITDIQRQVPFPLVVKGQHICEYVADWTYIEDGKLVVRDAKGRKTDVYKLKARLMFALYGIVILET